MTDGHRREKIITGDFFGFTRVDAFNRDRRHFPLSTFLFPLHSNDPPLHPHFPTTRTNLLRDRLPHLSRAVLGIEEPRNEAGLAFLLCFLKVAREEIFDGM